MVMRVIYFPYELIWNNSVFEESLTRVISSGFIPVKKPIIKVGNIDNGNQLLLRLAWPSRGLLSPSYFFYKCRQRGRGPMASKQPTTESYVLRWTVL